MLLILVSLLVLCLVGIISAVMMWPLPTTILSHSSPANTNSTSNSNTSSPKTDTKNWESGFTTYYTSNEGGDTGAGGKRLTQFKSVAVPRRVFKEYEGRKVDFAGFESFGSFVVEDSCAGGECKDFDIYVGRDVKNARQLPNYQAGVIPIKYRWV